MLFISIFLCPRWLLWLLGSCTMQPASQIFLKERYSWSCLLHHFMLVFWRTGFWFINMLHQRIILRVRYNYVSHKRSGYRSELSGLALQLSDKTRCLVHWDTRPLDLMVDKATVWSKVFVCPFGSYCKKLQWSDLEAEDTYYTYTYFFYLTFFVITQFSSVDNLIEQTANLLAAKYSYARHYITPTH